MASVASDMQLTQTPVTTPFILIRAPTIADCPSAAACQIACWREAYTEIVPMGVLNTFISDVAGRIDNWKSHISSLQSTILIAVNAGEVVGFTRANKVANRDTGRKKLSSLYVRAAWSGKGVGKMLMDGVLGGSNVLAEVWLFELNAHARRWYVNRGFGEEVKGRLFNEEVGRWAIKLIRE